LYENPSIDKSILIGRENEISQLFDNLANNRSITLLAGESGIGKSKLLDEFYRQLRYEHQNDIFVGYYDKSKSLISESQSLIYPFTIVLASLIEGAKQAQKLDERIDNTLNRLQKTLVKFAKEEGMKMVEAIIEDVAKKTGLEQTLKVARGFLKAWRAGKTSFMLAEDYVAQHKDDALQSYLGMFRSLADEFKDRSFVLIFDQFESAGKLSIDFFLNFVKFMPDRFHVIVAARRLYEDSASSVKGRGYATVKESKCFLNNGVSGIIFHRIFPYSLDTCLLPFCIQEYKMYSTAHEPFCIP
jgi:predicted ATPase